VVGFKLGLLRVVLGTTRARGDEILMIASSFSRLLAAAALSQRPLARRLGHAPTASITSWQREAESKGVEFVGGYVTPKDMPRLTVPEFTLVGRSNVGKSSALNALSFRKKKIAVVSKTPGRTRMINLFKVGKSCAITDLPGYGFAKVSKDLQDDWKKQITAYLRKRENLKLAVMFVDSQIDPRPQDAQLLDFLEAEEIPTLVVATKVDRLNKGELERNIGRLYEGLALPEGQPLKLSAKDGTGRTELWRTITDMCTNPK
jgi:GTP-binding protein